MLDADPRPLIQLLQKLEDLRTARDHGVTGSYLQGMRKAGYQGATLDEYREARDHGVDPEYAADWKEAGYTLTLRQLIRARDHGARAVVVSNHGGRQLDGSPATLDALGPIAEALAGAVEVWMDGGVRRGTDVLQALALGARAVLIGRPVLWGLAHDGEAGVGLVLEMLRRELDLAMALAGCPNVAAISRDLVSA